MEFDKLNTLIFETLEGIAPLGTSRVSMFNIDDKYSNVPFFRFKFKDKKKEDEIYKRIQVAINGFNGNLKWELVTRFDSENFLIIPIIDQENRVNWNDKESLIALYGESGYRKKIGEIIDDIPKLAKVISSCR